MALSSSTSTRPHGATSVEQLTSLWTALDRYAQTFHEGRTPGGPLWHPLAARKYVDPQTDELVVVSDNTGDRRGPCGPARDLAVLSVDFLSPMVCAAKVQLFTDAPPRRVTALLSLLRACDEGSQPSSWTIVQEVSTTDDLSSSSPPGCLIPPAALAADRASGRDDALGEIRRAAQTYLDANHLSDAALMRTCMDPSTVLFSVDPAGKAQGRYVSDCGCRSGTHVLKCRPTPSLPGQDGRRVLRAHGDARRGHGAGGAAVRRAAAGGRTRP
jgi:hypothetical protein